MGSGAKYLEVNPGSIISYLCDLRLIISPLCLSFLIWIWGFKYSLLHRSIVNNPMIK